MTTVLEVSGVTLAKGGHRILDDVSWHTHEGQHWVVLGPNGAGKSSLVRVATGRDLPTTGSVRVCGNDTKTADRAELGSVVGFASHTLAQRIRPSLRVLDVVRTAAWGASEAWDQTYEGVDDDRAAALLDAFGVTEFGQRRFSSLSEGERQRVLLARALMTDPEVLVLDEPTSGLDLGAREVLVRALSEIVAGPTAPQVVLVTHQIEEIPPGFTHALVMTQGRVHAAGPLDEVVTGVNLSAAFDLPLSAGSTDGRWWARAVDVPRN
ncbi:ATP-binding cassette domain-containing protein [Schaalia sp. 19OD2882]|uniref:ABC transporter ATP-binding protein n=1 Tax=Schaalia sp. 19OD2882 TaxID=2794089 RepID=UPI001C1ECEB3|nr:ATP-binding cassette domain-containing protein [Schaalia sp. 19OD2882]QWW20457.1 ATP-binding cassette domain-containing protein [Schaalia sp. 19OD2882]